MGWRWPPCPILGFWPSLTSSSQRPLHGSGGMEDYWERSLRIQDPRASPGVKGQVRVLPGDEGSVQAGEGLEFVRPSGRNQGTVVKR